MTNSLEKKLAHIRFLKEERKRLKAEYLNGDKISHSQFEVEMNDIIIEIAEAISDYENERYIMNCEGYI